MTQPLDMERVFSEQGPELRYEPKAVNATAYGVFDTYTDKWINRYFVPDSKRWAEQRCEELNEVWSVLRSAGLDLFSRTAAF